MKTSVVQAIAQGCIKPALDLLIRDEDREEFREGVVYDKIPEVLTRGHNLNQERISRLEVRAQFSQYVVLPTKFNFKVSFRVTMLVIKFVSLCRRGKPFQGPKLSSPLNKLPKIFTIVCAQKDNQSVSPSMLDLNAMLQDEMY